MWGVVVVWGHPLGHWEAEWDEDVSEGDNDWTVKKKIKDKKLKVNHVTVPTTELFMRSQLSVFLHV